MDQHTNEGTTDGQEHTSSSPGPYKRTKSKKTLVTVGVIVVLAAVAGAVYANPGLREQIKGAFVQSEPVAIVNGTEITNKEFNVRFEQAKQSQGAAQGQNAPSDEELKTQVLEGMINEELLLQEAKAQGITADKEEVQKQFDQIKDQFENNQAFKDEIASAGTSEDELRDTIERSAIIRTYLEQKVPSEDIEVSDDKVQEQVDRINEQTEGSENAPDTEQIRGLIEQQLVQQQRQQKILALLEELKQDAEIETFEERL